MTLVEVSHKYTLALPSQVQLVETAPIAYSYF